MKALAPLFFLISMLLPTLGHAQLLDTTRIKQTALDGSVPVSTDDAEQLNNAIDKLYDDDLDAGWEGDEFNVAITGMRFRNVNVPKGAIIDSAFVQLFAHEDEGDPALITIRAEAADSAITYNDVDLISARPTTTASVFWSATENWVIWNQYRTPELKNLVQEVVNRSGWKAGNALAFSFTGQDQGASTLDNARDIESFENVEDPDDGGDGLNHPERIPKLFIYYHLTSSTLQPVLAQVLQVAPNPARTGQIALNTAPFEGQDALIRLIDTQGRLLRQWNFSNLPDTNLHLSVDGLPNGLHYLELRTALELGIAKVILK
jgi:hypothetical protein